MSFALKGAVKEFDLLTVLTRVCLEFDLSSVQVIECQLYFTEIQNPI